MASFDKIRLYESAELGVRYVYGAPVSFPLVSKFTDDPKLGTAKEQCARLREAYGLAKEAAIAKAEQLASRRSA